MAEQFEIPVGTFLRILAIAVLVGLGLGIAAGGAVYVLWLDSPALGVPVVLH
jgi:hypothetical protein